MSITIQDVKHIAKLARLELSENDKEKFVFQMNDILQHIEKLNELDTTTIEPLLQVIELHNVFREDSTKPSISPDDALKNAPAKVDTLFKVPKVIG